MIKVETWKINERTCAIDRNTEALLVPLWLIPTTISYSYCRTRPAIEDTGEAALDLTRYVFYVVRERPVTSSGSDGIVSIPPILPLNGIAALILKSLSSQVTLLGRTSLRRRPYTGRHSCWMLGITIAQNVVIRLTRCACVHHRHRQVDECDDRGMENMGHWWVIAFGLLTGACPRTRDH